MSLFRMSRRFNLPWYDRRMIRRAAWSLAALLLAPAALRPHPAAAVPQEAAEVTLLDATLGQPTALSFTPDGRLFIAEKAGAIKIFKNGAMNAAPYATVSPVYTGNTESG